MSENASELNDQSVQGDDRRSRYLLSFLERSKWEETMDSISNSLDGVWPFNQAHEKIGTIDDALKRFEERNPLQDHSE